MSRRKWSDNLFLFFAFMMTVTFASCGPDTSSYDTNEEVSPDASTMEEYATEAEAPEPQIWSEQAEAARRQAEAARRQAEAARRQAEAARQAEENAVISFINGLSLGDFFHNVPKELSVDVETIIQAGIAKDVSDQLLSQLSMTPNQEITIEQSIARYDPTGTEIVFWADEKAFDIEPIESGKKTIISGDEQLWSWRIKPLKAGEYFIILKAIVEVRIQGSDKEYPSREFVLFTEKRRVRGNLIYSSRQFAANNPGLAISSVIGSSSLGGLVGSLLARRQANLKAEAESKRTVGFARTKATNKNS